jgi:hypothetical protein
MVDTTTPKASSCRPLDTDSRAGAPEIEVTPAMIEAGVMAYYENAVGGWENPGVAELRKMLGDVFTAMWSSCPRRPLATKYPQ